MSIEDENRAKRALSHYLIEWGVADAPRMAHKFIDELVGQGWQMDPSRESRPRPPRAHEACQECQRHVERCICEGGATDRLPQKSPPNPAYLAARAATAVTTRPTPTNPKEHA